MKTLLSAACDNALHGLSRWFTDWHIGHCPRCRAALAALRELHRRLRALGTPKSETQEGLAPEQWTRLEAAWREADGGT